MITRKGRQIRQSLPRDSTILLIVLIWSLINVGSLAGCPKVCECKWRDGKEVVACRDAHFIDIPRGLDPSTQVLDLRHNNLRILPKDSFVYTGLTNLQKVWLSYCNLMKVEDGAFRMLANVVELDLSNNFLRSVPTTALKDMGGLRELRLAHNSLTYISSTTFLPTPELVQLDISHNMITALEKGALRELIYLEELDISENKIQTLDASELIPLTVLRVINIDGNPWDCDCHLKSLRMWLNDYGLTPSPQPLCSHPRWLYGQAWQHLNIEEFVCVPQVSAIAPRVLASEGENVTLVCQVKSEVETTITWLVGDSPIQYSNESERYYVTEIAIPDYNSYVSNLTMTGVIPQDQGTYRCIAENRAGYREVNLTLQVSHEVAEVRIATVEPTTSYVKNGLVMGIAVAIFISLLFCSLIYCKLRSGQSAQQENDKVDQPQTSGHSDSDAHKLVGYHMVPTNELEEVPSKRSLGRQHTWRTRGTGGEVGLGGQYSPRIGENPHSFETNLGHTIDPRQAISHPPAPNSSVSYVEIPKSGVGAVRTTLEDQAQWKDVLVHSKDLIPPANCVRSASQMSVRNSAQYPDLLDLPRRQGQEIYIQGNNIPLQMMNLSYCTLPRTRSKSCADAGNVTGESDGRGDSTASSSFSHPYDAEYRSSSALNLALSEAASQAYAQGQIPIGGHPLLPGGPTACGPQNAQAMQELLAAQRISCNTNMSGSEQASSGQDPYRFEYHAAQLEKFLQEYRSLQQQLQVMKQSYQAHQRTGSAPRLDCCNDNRLSPPSTGLQPTTSSYMANQPYTTHIQTDTTISQPHTTVADPTVLTKAYPSPPPPYLSPSQSAMHYPAASQPYHDVTCPSSSGTQPYPETTQCYVPAPEAFGTIFAPCTSHPHPCHVASSSYTSPSVPYAAIPTQCQTASSQAYTVPLQMCPREGRTCDGIGIREEIGGGGSEESGSPRDSRSSPHCSEVSVSPPTVTFPTDDELPKPKMLNKGAHPKEPLKSILKKTNSFDTNGKQQQQLRQQPPKHQQLLHPQLKNNQWKS